MLHHKLDDPAIQFEMATATSGMRKPTVGVVARTRVIRCGIRGWDALLERLCNELLLWDAVGAPHVDWQTRDPLGLIVCQRNDEEIWSGSESDTWVRDTRGRKRA